jgi:HSP20 family protein
MLGDALDAEHIEASYHAGVLRLSVPVTEKARPRKIAIQSGDGQQAITANSQSQPVNA